MRNNKNNIVAIWIITLLFITIILLLINQEYNREPTISKVVYGNKYNSDRTRKVTLKINQLIPKLILKRN